MDLAHGKPAAGLAPAPAGREAHIRRFVSRARVRAEETGGLHSVIEHALPAGVVAMPPHRHPSVAKTILVTAGELWVRLNGRDRRLRAGECVAIPAGAEHAFWTRGGDHAPCASFLTVASPGGLERYYEEVADLIGGGAIDIAKVLEASARHGVEVDMAGLLDLVERHAVHLA